MKKLLTLILVLSAWNLFAQLMLVKETNSNLFANTNRFILSNGDKMFYSSSESFITLFKSDFTVYKVVNLPELFPQIKTDSMIFKFYGRIELVENLNYLGAEINCTDHFFNNDDKIEFVVSCSYRNGQTIKVLLNEDGTELQRFTSNYDFQLKYWDNLYMIQRLNDSYPYNYNTKIFSIPGNLPCTSSCSQKAAGIAPITQPNEFKEIQVNGFPNPSSDKVTLVYALPEGVAFGTLRLYTQTGELVKEFKVSSQIDHLELPVSEYTPGTYYYELQAGGSTSGGKKMVVIH